MTEHGSAWSVEQWCVGWVFCTVQSAMLLRRVGNPKKGIGSAAVAAIILQRERAATNVLKLVKLINRFKELSEKIDWLIIIFLQFRYFHSLFNCLHPDSFHWMLKCHFNFYLMYFRQVSYLMYQNEIKTLNSQPLVLQRGGCLTIIILRTVSTAKGWWVFWKIPIVTLSQRGRQNIVRDPLPDHKVTKVFLLSYSTK